ncbi:MAG: signal recognition particle-docking protein FtsY [Neisseriaceae bacterium]|nr:signal recognition particle-docking protein FtsY [Neisseriaceae bacterium]
MFGLFKRKKKIETPETVDTPVVEEVSNEQTPDETVIEHIESEIQQTPVIEETRQAETMTENFRQPEKIHIPDIESFRQSKQAAMSVVQTPEPEPKTEPEPAKKSGWFSRLKQGLTKSRDKLGKSLATVFGGGQIDEDLYEELETVLLTSDMGVEATERLLSDVRKRDTLKGLKDASELKQALKEALRELLQPLEQPLVLPEKRDEPFVIMMAGVNGAGKTTSIGKLAKLYQSENRSVLLAAGDTFRAAAREQLIEWGNRNDVTVISQEKGESAAVCFDAVEAAKARKIDIVLADTAGRLPTQLHLMEEIKKVKRVLQKSMPDAPHEILLVLDANIGQNAVNQVVAFDDALGLTGLVLTKLDGTAKGGVIAALAAVRPIPVRYIGVGESIDDLRPFVARDFVDALLPD